MPFARDAHVAFPVLVCNIAWGTKSGIGKVHSRRRGLDGQYRPPTPAIDLARGAECAAVHCIVVNYIAPAWLIGQIRAFVHGRFFIVCVTISDFAAGIAFPACISTANGLE